MSKWVYPYFMQSSLICESCNFSLVHKWVERCSLECVLPKKEIPDIAYFSGLGTSFDFKTDSLCK